jgi:clan AA aspartic protease (TIGR02281 family)
LSKKDPFHEEYGRHSSFRPVHNAKPEGLPYVKLFVVVLTLAVAVFGFDHWRRGLGKASPSVHPVAVVGHESTPVDAQQEESAPPPEAPVAAMAEAPVPEPARAWPAEEPPTSSEDEKPVSLARYVMEMNPRSNSFMGRVLVNGKSFMALADTGASVVVIPEKIAEEIGLKKGVELTFGTGGGAVTHFSTTLGTLTLGQIELRNVDAAINPAMQENFILLGMSALSLMEMQQEQGKLVLKYRQEAPVAPGLASVEGFKRSSKDCTNRGNKFNQQTLDCLKGR